MIGKAMRLTVFAVIIGTSFPAAARDWSMLTETSTLTFEVSQLGSPIEGRFGTFEVAIRFDPSALDQASVRVAIDLQSVDTGNGERDAEIKGANWFDAGNHPQAVFQSTVFEPSGDGYIVHGELTMRGITHAVAMPVSIEIVDQSARAMGELVVERTDFDVGIGQWATGATIGTTVTIRFDVEAVAAG